MESFTQQNRYGSSSLATASFILGIVSLVMISLGLSVFIGALAVILALLSRGTGRMHTGAVAGMITGIIGICLEMLILAGALLLLPAEQMDEFQEYFQEIYEEYQEPDSSPMASGTCAFPGDNIEFTEWTYHLTEQEFAL